MQLRREPSQRPQHRPCRAGHARSGEARSSDDGRGGGTLCNFKRLVATTQSVARSGTSRSRLCVSALCSANCKNCLSGRYSTRPNGRPLWCSSPRPCDSCPKGVPDSCLLAEKFSMQERSRRYAGPLSRLIRSRWGYPQAKAGCPGPSPFCFCFPSATNTKTWSCGTSSF